MKLTVIILNFETSNLLNQCLKSIFKYGCKYSFQVWVVDNSSSDNSVKMVEENHPQVVLTQNKDNLGFAGGNNVALKKTDAEYVLLLNSDTEIFEDSLNNLVDFMDRSKFGIGSCKLVNKDGSLQPNTGDLPFGAALINWLSGIDGIFPEGIDLPSFHRNSSNFYIKEREVGWVSGTAMMIRKKVLEKIGLLDDSIFMYGEDTDYCIRAKQAGFKIGWTDKATVLHLGGGSLKDSKYNQWYGEFTGLLYIYKKYFGKLASFLLKILFYIFISLRIFFLFVTGEKKVYQTYAKILFAI